MEEGAHGSAGSGVRFINETNPGKGKKRVKELEAQLNGMEKEMEKLLLRWQREMSGHLSRGGSSITQPPQIVVERNDVDNDDVNEDDVAKELQQIDREMEALLQRRREAESRSRTATATATTTSIQAAASSDDHHQQREKGPSSPSLRVRRGSSGVQPTRRKRNPSIALGSERIVMAANGDALSAPAVTACHTPSSLSSAEDGEADSAKETHDDGASPTRRSRSTTASPMRMELTKKVADTPDTPTGPTYRRSRSFVLPASVKGADIIQALKELADAESLATTEAGGRHRTSTSSGSSGDDTSSPRSSSPRSLSPRLGFLTTISPRGLSSSPPTISSSSSPPTSLSPSASSSSSSSSSSRRHHFLTFTRKKGRESSREERAEEDVAIAATAGQREDGLDNKSASSGKRVARTKSLRMHFTPWSKEEMDKAREERKKSGGKARSSLGATPTVTELGGDGQRVSKDAVRRSVDAGVPAARRRQSVADRQEEAYGEYHQAEEARWDGYAKEASLIDQMDEDSGFYHFNVYFSASNRAQARQFHAGLDRFLQQFDAAAQATDYNAGLLGPIWVTAPKVLIRPNGEVEKDMG